MKRYIVIIATLFSILIFSGCSDSAKTSQTPQDLTNTATLTGTITNAAGAPILGARVSDGTNDTLTDDTGHYSLGVDADQNVSITADFLNYVQNAHSINISKDETANLDLTLVNVDNIIHFDASSGVIATVKGAKITLPSSAYVLADGTLYSGEVTAKIAYNRVTSVSGESAFPGTFIGLQEDGSSTGIRSYGFIDVTLQDANGNPLQLADGATAVLTYPMDPNIAETPATIPLWYYDVDKGIWIEEGQATYDAISQTYSGNVSHFTTWNLDAKFNGAQFQGCLEDGSGQRISDSELYVITSGWRKIKHNTDSSGTFKFINAPSDLNITFYAKANDLYSRPFSFNLSPGEQKNLSSCIVVDQNINQLFVQVKGKVMASDGSPMSNISVSINDLYGTNLNQSGIATDNNGNFISNIFMRPNDPRFTVSIRPILSGQTVPINTTTLLDPVQRVTDIGTVVVAATHIQGCITRFDGNTSFDNTTLSLFIDTSLVEQRGGIQFFDTSNFDIYISKDYKDHSLFSKFSDYTNVPTAPSRTSAYPDPIYLYGMQTINADQDFVDTTEQCMVLSPEGTVTKTVSANITSSHSNINLEVLYDTYSDYRNPYIYGQKVIDYTANVKSGSFNMTKNGIYFIVQSPGDCIYTDFDGTLSISVDGQSYIVTIPNAQSTNNQAWIGFAIEYFQGNIKVVPLNKAGGAGYCD